MSKRRAQVPQQLKEQIIAKLFESEGTVPELSELYGVSRSTLYKWVYKERRLRGLTAQYSSSNCFVELLVKEPSNDLKRSGLQKASLTFADFSLFIEGKISSNKIMSILKILEGSC